MSSNIGVKYTGFLSAESGMGEAARSFVAALHKSGVNVTAEDVPNLRAEKNLGEDHELSRSLNRKDIDYKFKIIHTTPDLVTKYLEPTKYHIFHLFWETTRLPEWWVWALNLMDEVWTGSEWNKKVFIDSGVTKPITIFPQPVRSASSTPLTIKGHGAEYQQFKFYSVFQWIERKNPRALLEAYWEEFQDEDVVLILKTYKEKHSTEETTQIIRDIVTWRQELGQAKYPQVLLYPYELSRKTLDRLHESGDCFVSAHRGEGWGRPIAEAMLHSKPVISTNLGGVHEFIPPDCAKLIEYKMVPVFNMDFVPWYEKDQEWAEIDKGQLRLAMRSVFNNQQIAKKMGERGKELVESILSYRAVGDLMKKRLEEI